MAGNISIQDTNSKQTATTDQATANNNIKVKYPTEVVHMPQIHLDPDGNPTPEVKRFQFELAKYLEREITKNPNIAVFTEGLPIELKYEEAVSSEVQRTLDAWGEKVSTPTGDQWIFKPENDPLVKQNHNPQYAEELSKVVGPALKEKNILKEQNINGVTENVFDLDKLKEFCAKTLREELGIDKALPADLSQISESGNKLWRKPKTGIAGWPLRATTSPAMPSGCGCSMSFTPSNELRVSKWTMPPRLRPSSITSKWPLRRP